MLVFFVLGPPNMAGHFHETKTRPETRRDRARICQDKTRRDLHFHGTDETHRQDLVVTSGAHSYPRSGTLFPGMVPANQNIW